MQKMKVHLLFFAIVFVSSLSNLATFRVLPTEPHQSRGMSEVLQTFSTKSFVERNDTMPEALDCLRQTKPNLPNLTYPDDAYEHFLHIHEGLKQWTQGPSHKPHEAANYEGPWIENRWITHFQKQLESKNNNLQDVFGPYIPILIPWTDVWLVDMRMRYPSDLPTALMNLLREDVMYITVSQNDDGFVGRCLEMEHIQERFHITILSAGGYGHVPIPLLKQPEKINNMIPIGERKHLISYVGSKNNAPYAMRKKMVAQKNHYYYYGEDWRQVMAESKFSLSPRGYGRTSVSLSQQHYSGSHFGHGYAIQLFSPPPS